MTTEKKIGLKELRERGCIHDMAHPEELEKLLGAKSISFYCGFDPTADSLHAGSMIPLILMRRLQEAGHKPIVVLGTGTGMIGDPSGRSAERNLLDDETIEKNTAGIEKQIKRFLSDKGTNAYVMVRNDEWLRKINLIDFLRDIGKHFSVNMMIAKDSVKARLENREQGISYTEFSYMLLQAYDYFHLYKTMNCRLQVGGSDQWGNITAGMDLINKKSEKNSVEAFALTFPLLTTASGAKFGKTAEGAVWLDETKTSPYKFYQYWLNTADEDVIKYIKIFTSAQDAEIKALEERIKSKPEAREAQKYLAETLTTLVHGEANTKGAEQASSVLFGESFANVNAATLLDIFKEVPSSSITKAELSKGIGLVDLLVSAKAGKSKGDARRLIEGGGIYINNERQNDPAATIGLKHFVEENVLVIRSGKKNFYLVRATS